MRESLYSRIFASESSPATSADSLQAAKAIPQERIVAFLIHTVKCRDRLKRIYLCDGESRQIHYCPSEDIHSTIPNSADPFYMSVRLPRVPARLYLPNGMISISPKSRRCKSRQRFSVGLFPYLDSPPAQIAHPSVRQFQFQGDACIIKGNKMTNSIPRRVHLTRSRPGNKGTLGSVNLAGRKSHYSPARKQSLLSHGALSEGERPRI